MNQTPDAIQPTGNPATLALRPQKSSSAIAVLRKSAEDAYYLHNYSITAGKEIPEDVSQAIIEFKQQCDQEQAGAIDLNVEVRFSSAYRQLAALMAPVTVESLRETEEMHSDPNLPALKRLRFSRARQVAMLLPTIAILLILTILACEIVQAIFIPGLRDINDKQKQLETLMTGIGNNPNVLDQIDTGNNEIKAMLKNLKATWDNLIFLPAISSPGDMDEAWTDDPEKVRLMKARFQIIVETLNHLLPVLYGALGATVFLLRVLIPHITLRTFNRKHAGSISVRICLGMISGVAIQWFFVGQQAQIFERSLSTSALAFLAGYNMDLVFTMMDRFVQGFKIPKSPEKSEPEPRFP